MTRKTLLAAVLTACIALPLLTVFTVSREQEPTQPAAGSAASDLLPHLDTARSCDSMQPVTERDLTACTWLGEPDRLPLYLLGDSQTGQLAEAATAAAASLGRTMVLATQSACPLAQLKVFRDGALNQECGTYVESVLQWIKSQRQGTILIAMTEIYVRDSGWTLQLPDGRMAKSQDEKAHALEAGMRSVVQVLIGDGFRVLLVRPTPKFWTMDTDGRVSY